MSNLRAQKRLAASVKNCGKKKIWLDPNESVEISGANTRLAIRRLINDGLIIAKPVNIHSKFRTRKNNIARLKGRHSGHGKRKGTKESRMPTKKLWTQRMRVLRLFLRKYRSAKKIDCHLYSQLYLKVKGNHFRNKRNLMEYIFKKKATMLRSKQLKEQAAAHRHTAREARLRREQRIAERKRESLLRYEEADRHPEQLQETFMPSIEDDKKIGGDKTKIPAAPNKGKKDKAKKTTKGKK